MTAILEGLLFIAGENGITIEEIMNLLNLDQKKVTMLIGELKTIKQQEISGLMIKEVAGKYILTTKPEHIKYYQKLANFEIDNSLSQAALETLALIAYNEPITRIEIDQLRGVSTASMIRKLISFNLITEAGRSTQLGRPYLYKTTNYFLDYFNINSLDELPKIDFEPVDSKEEDLYSSKYREN